MIGLKPWEYYRYTIREYTEAVDGSELKQQLQLDGVRFLATVVAKSAGSKKIKKPSDLMKLPLIDGKPDKDKLARLVEFYESEKAKRDGNGKPGNNN